jgi:hypothetical protein
MSAIIKYKCDNKDCSAIASIEMNFPVWRSNAPKEMRKIPVGIRFAEYVAGYVNKAYCTVCRSKQSYLKGSITCLGCGKEDTFVKEDDICPKCNIGTLKEDENGKVLF